MNAKATPDRIDTARAALIAYDVCRRALTPADPARREAMRPVLDAWVRMIAAARAAGLPVIHTPPVSRVSRAGGAAADQRSRRHAGGRVPRRDRAASRGLCFPEAPAERLLRH